MEKIDFADGWRDFFAGYGFRSFNDFFRYTSGMGIHTGGRKNVHYLTLGEGDGRKVIYIKRFNYPHIEDIISSRIQFGRIKSQGAVEWENANYLLDMGIGTYYPVCYGERTLLGIERQSFIATEEVKGVCLTDFVCERWGEFSREQKEELMRKLGKFIRRMHNAGINFPDLYIWHIFVREENGEYDFSVIDLHRMEQKVKAGNKQISNLGRFKYSMLDKYFDESLHRLFLESYAGDEWAGGVDKLVREVKRYSRKIHSRRNQKNY